MEELAIIAVLLIIIIIFQVLNTYQTEQIMALIDDLNGKVSDLQIQVTDLQTAVDAEQAAIAELLSQNAAVVTGLNQQIADLQAIVASGATPEQLASVITSLTGISGSIATTKADIEGTV